MSIRWDAVVDRSAADFGRPPPRSRSAVCQVANRFQVRIRLFGALASLSAEQTIQFELDAGATLADMLAVAGERFGESFLAHVLDETGAKRRHCRMFAGGYPVDDLQTQLSATIDPSNIDIILLIAPEGG